MEHLPCILSYATAQDKDNVVIGYVRVKNLAYEKRIVIRFSLNNWATYSDLAADWVESIGGTTEHPESDKFRFVIHLPSPNWSGTVEFAVRYDVAGWTFWDNNRQRNYTIVVDRNKG